MGRGIRSTGGSALDLVAEGDNKHTLEVELSDDHIVVTSLGGPGATIVVIEDGKQVRAR